MRRASSKCVWVGVTTLKASAPAMASSSEAKTGTRHFSAIFGGLLRRSVMHAGEFDLARRGHFRINARMFLAQRANPQHGDFKFLIQHLDHPLRAVVICQSD